MDSNEEMYLKQIEKQEKYTEKLLKQLNEQIKENKELKKEIKQIKSSIRYKIGRDIIKASKPSKHTLVLPFRLMKYIKEGIEKKIYVKDKAKITPELEKSIMIPLELSKYEKLKELESEFNEAYLMNKLEIGKKLYREYKDLGRLTQSKILLEKMLILAPESTFYVNELEIVCDKLKILESFNEDKWTSGKISTYRAVEGNKILHVLNNSIPYHKNGYGIRSKYIVESQKNVGLQPIVITRPGFPNDFKEDTLQDKDDLIIEEILGIRYYRCLPQQFLRYTSITKYIENYTEQIIKVVEKEQPFAIHAASNYINGLAGLRAARACQLPFIYEIRGFWELTTVSKRPYFRGSEEFELAQKI